MFGDGSTHGKPVSSANRSRRHPSILTISRSAPRENSSLNNRASSPIVMPCRIGIGKSPTKDSKPGTRIAPSTSTPPIGFGRSHTMTGILWRPHALRQLAIV
jgi:hypothetical protein